MKSTESNNRAASHDFQTALRLLEERLRSLEDSEDIINGLLQGAAEFYGAARASVVEADWDLKIGLLTYEWCAEGVEHQKDMLQYLAVESFPRWCEFLSLNRPVVIPDMEAIKDTCRIDRLHAGMSRVCAVQQHRSDERRLMPPPLTSPRSAVIL